MSREGDIHDVDDVIRLYLDRGSKLLNASQLRSLNKNLGDIDFGVVLAYLGLLADGKAPGVQSRSEIDRHINNVIRIINQPNDDKIRNLITVANRAINAVIDEFRSSKRSKKGRTIGERVGADDDLVPIDNDQFALEYREQVGGPIWQGILDREREYWDNVTNKRTSQRPDWKDPVGGLIDITDKIPGLYGQFLNPDTSDWLVGAGISEDAELYAHPYNVEVIDEIVLGSFKKNFVIAGGYPLHVVTGARAHDLDLFMIDPNSNGKFNPDWIKIIKRYLSFLNEKYQYAITITTEHSITVDGINISDGIPNKLQIILRVYHSVTEVLMGFDLGACGVGIYNDRIYATERALYEIINRTIMVEMNRASTSYPYRLIKYALKGFGLYVPGIESFPEHSDNYFFEETPSILESIDLMVRKGGWLAKKIGRGQWQYPNLPLGMSSDYSDHNNSGANDMIDYNQSDDQPWKPSHRYNNPSKIPNDLPIIYQNPFRQGSLSFHPVIMTLREWAGPDAIINENKLLPTEDVTGISTEGEPAVQLLDRITSIVNQKLLDRLADHPDWIDLEDDDLMLEFSKLFKSSTNITDLVGLSLLRYYHGR